MLNRNKLSVLSMSGLKAVVLASTLAMSSCNSTNNNLSNSGNGTGFNAAPVVRALTPNPNGEVIGNGPVRISLLVPTTIPGGAAAIASQLRNGAAMAMQDFGQQVQLVVKDTKGQAAETQARADEAIKEGSSIILGPLFAANVSATSGISLPARIPVIAFSTDTSVARRGVYLFSYTPQSGTTRIVQFAAKRGLRSIYAFLPRNAEGDLRERVLRQAASTSGIFVNVARYDVNKNSVKEAVDASAQAVQTSDAIFIPDGGPIPNAIMMGLRGKGIQIGSKQVLGSGKWEKVNAGDPGIQGAFYPGRDVSRFNQFASRYKTQFGTDAGVNAGLAYEAVTFITELLRSGGANGLTPSNIESARGFQGINGSFRIQQSGITQRSLAIYQINASQKQLVEPATGNFQNNGS